MKQYYGFLKVVNAGVTRILNFPANFNEITLTGSYLGSNVLLKGFDIANGTGLSTDALRTKGVIDWINGVGNANIIHTLKNRQRNVFLDAGCHTGYFTCLFNNHFKKIIGFEPSVKCVEALELLKKEYNNFIYYNCFLGNVNKPVISQQYDDGWAFVQENTTEIKSLELQQDKGREKKKLDTKK